MDMAKELIKTGKTTEEAIENACRELGVSKEQCSIEILEEAKSGFLGIFKKEAKVKVTVCEEAATEPQTAVAEETKAEIAVEEPAVASGERNPKLTASIDYLRSILDCMGLQEFTIEVEEHEESATLTIQGDKKKLGVLIGRHGETLDALQYLVFLACTRVEGNYYRVTLNCGNYRESREESLKELAKRTAAKAKKTGRSQMLEAMNAYERRIIHAEISAMDQVISKSKGEEPHRRVVVIPTDAEGQPINNRRGGNRGNGRGGYNQNRGGYRKNRRPEKTMEEILKEDRAEKAVGTAAPAADKVFLEEEKSSKLYSKIEL